MKKFWMALAALFALTALVFAFRRDFDKAFITAALGAVSWFLSYRAQMREMITSVDKLTRQNEADEQDDESD